MKKYLILTLILLISCGTDFGMDISEEELVQKILEADAKITNYKTDMTMKMSGQVSYGPDTMDMDMDVLTETYVDTVNEKLKSTTTLVTQLFGMKNEITQETYIVDNYLYTQTLGTWMKTKLKQGLWNEQNTLESTVALLENSEIEKLPDKTIEGDEFLVIKITPTVEHIRQQMGELKSMFGEDEDYSDLIQSFSETIFINKETFYLEKLILSFVLEMENTEEEEGSFNINVDALHEFSEFNTDYSFELPPEAADAIELGSMFDVKVNDDGMGAVTGNVVDRMAKS